MNGFYLSSYYISSNLLYIVLVLPAFILSLIAQARVKTTYSKMAKVRNISGYTGARAAEAVLRYYGITDVTIEETRGKLTDHFDPRSKVIRLSSEVYHSSSIASVGIACHEAGHAAQHARNYVPIKIRNSIIPVCNIGSYLGIPIAFAGYFLGFEPLILVGLGLYSLIAVFQLVTLPVEFNASARAVRVIEETGLLRTEDEINGTKKVLSAAAMTYVAALAVTLANLLRFAIMFLGRGRRNN